MNDNLTVQDTPADDATVSLAFPEGGREAWSCLLGAFLLVFGSFGFQTSGKKATCGIVCRVNQFPPVGTIQYYISTHQLSDYSVRDVGWETAVLDFLTLFLGVQVGPLFARCPLRRSLNRRPILLPNSPK